MFLSGEYHVMGFLAFKESLLAFNQFDMFNSS